MVEFRLIPWGMVDGGWDITVSGPWGRFGGVKVRAGIGEDDWIIGAV